MKIFYLITKSETGGAQTHIYQLSKHLISNGHQVAMMSYPGGWQKGGWLEKEIVNMGGTFYPNNFLSNDINPIKDWLAIIKIKKAIKDFNPDLISCHSSKAGFLGRIAIRNKIPTVFTAHGWGFTQGTSWERRFLVPLEMIASCFCSKIICVSENDNQLAIKHKIAPAQKIITIHNGVEIGEDFVFNYNKFKILPIKIVFVGRFAIPKDQLMFLKAFLQLPFNVKQKVAVIFVGDGPERSKAESFIKQNSLDKQIQITGDIPRSKVFEILADSNIFVLISGWEGFPRTILEAMSFGLPIISSDVGGAKEAVGEKNGFLIKPDDITTLTKRLEQLILNPDLMIQMGQYSRQRAEEEFSLERMIEKTVALYQEILTLKK